MWEGFLLPALPGQSQGWMAATDSNGILAANLFR
jgi:hypothetical protein